MYNNFTLWACSEEFDEKGVVLTMVDKVYEYPDDIEIVEVEYSDEVSNHFTSIPDVAKPLLWGAKSNLKKIEEMLYTAPSFLAVLRASVPDVTFQAILSDEQKAQLASGALKLLTKKDGSLQATLVNPNTGKMVANIPLEAVNLSPEMTQAMNTYATQMQMAEIAEQIRMVQIAVEEVRQGQEFDRLATAYSCQQKLLQAMAIKNPELKTMALLRIVSDAEDSRNLLMQSQSANVAFIQSQPETFWGKLISGADTEKIDSRMVEIRENMNAVNMVSLAEAMAYQEMGEIEAAQLSLQYYADFVRKTYLDAPGLMERLDMIDPSPEQYWSRTLPSIEKKIKALPCNRVMMLQGEN